LKQFTDHKDEDYKKYALYKHNHTESLSNDIKDQILGKKRDLTNDTNELSKAIQLEHVRDYIFT
jgi:hypothetical protein